MLKKAAANHHVILWGIFVLSLAVRSYDLSGQPATDDDAGMASSATNYLLSGMFGQVMWYHPPFRNILVFLFGWIFNGYTAWGLKGAAVLTGSLTVLLIGYVAYNLFENKKVAYLAAFFLCIDPLHINASRQVIQEALTTFFIALGVLAAWKGISRDKALWLYVSGAFFGLASATKWHGLFPWIVSAGAYLAYPFLRPGAGPITSLPARFATALAAYGAIPLTIYIATYLPWLDRGYSLVELFHLQAWLVKYQYLHKGSVYNEAMVPKHAYEWFLRPVPWFDFAYLQGKPYVGVAMGNFLTWGLTLPALYYCIKTWVRVKTIEVGYVVALFLAVYLPLVLTTRGIWVLLATPTILMAFIMIAYFLSSLMDKGSLSKRVLVIYLTLVLLLSAFMYPLSIFKTLDFSWTRSLAMKYAPPHEARQ